MSSFEEQISDYNKWTIDYTKKVIVEYERFMILKSTNPNSSPSESIEKLWHYHILCTESYYNYCMQKFNKIIHHNINNNIDQYTKISLLVSTIQQYKQYFNNFIHEEIWIQNISISPNLIELVHKNYKKEEEYPFHEPPINAINIYIKYKTETIFQKYNKQIITYYPKIGENINTLLDLISRELIQNKNLINIFFHPKINYENYKNFIVNGKINENLQLNYLLTSKCYFLIVKITNNFEL